MNGHALKPVHWTLLVSAVEHASTMVHHTDISLGSALDASCRRLGYELDDDSYSIAIVALAKYRDKLSLRRAAPVTPRELGADEECSKTGEQP